MMKCRVFIVAVLIALSGCDIDFGDMSGGGYFLKGEAVPSLATKTLKDVGGDMAKLTSYRYPDPRMYQWSVDEALKQHKPIVLEFATPGHCTQCDKQLQLLKEMMNKYGDQVLFLHMDQYYNPEAYDAFQVRGEPWTFIVNAEGKVEMVYPGRMLYQEIDPVLELLTQGKKL
ncbi:MAG: thiol reductase thioredoxin [Zetaproteobacteria bacterium CG_4_9_14_3_um_filter_49_83]|nr:MAG: thiol reductase thioredoxin [Zetaproteobacteria bacterium CG1_02_49_23]PIQ33442.1 MAG: thiol reductase thioredoxin [Zetaproteobacteria bacterium CG17_big_fil_post_rev_8_21_14_2_50_50_13]PIV29111.1 MAG: thiol reductase thioredoxin [Zetaproteobacteria bacterium CG02_land_8_20_14_3_00_50_9]PIY55649.1 MAG: thiol reductase thioredoxin [Zetaproteobacteria bacterium CG_4_10_14_0_8_um_filter_49_80]PJA35999.1 MAG: thiol reductase thioredoxin [Zetaproteobacteria bacterium CG_4_9_14_3_um_filter_49